jgi:hypothetical protein
MISQLWSSVSSNVLAEVSKATAFDQKKGKREAQTGDHTVR